MGKERAGGEGKSSVSWLPICITMSWQCFLPLSKVALPVQLLALSSSNCSPPGSRLLLAPGYSMIPW